MLRALNLSLLLLAFPAPGLVTAGEAPQPQSARGWLPESCRPLLELAAAQGDPAASQPAEARWNLHYRHGYDAIERRDLETAERAFCQALEAALDFGPRDLRFAETLDELGLVNYLRGDDAQAEAMQGAATAEILLSLGPPADDLSAEQRDLCRSSLASYLARLGWVFARQGRGGQVEDLERAPYRILGFGYLPADALVNRLDWLISRYLLAEDMAAADWLTALRQRLRAELAVE